MRRRATMSEDNLQIHLVKLLNAFGRPDICFWHVPNGKKRSKKDGAKLKQMGVRRGVSDIHLMVDTRFHVVELKTEVGVLDGEQLSFREDLERAGGYFHVAFGLDQAIGVLKGLNAFRPNISITTAVDGGGARSRPWEAKAPGAGKPEQSSPVRPRRAADPVSPST